MANVFGDPISSMTDSSIRARSGRADLEITAADRARAAIYMKSGDSKDTKARSYVENLKMKWGNGVSTLCLVYNATGNTITYVSHHDFMGTSDQPHTQQKLKTASGVRFCTSKPPERAAAGSTAAVVYRGSNGKGTDCDFMMAWSNPWEDKLLQLGVGKDP